MQDFKPSELIKKQSKIDTLHRGEEMSFHDSGQLKRQDTMKTNTKRLTIICLTMAITSCVGKPGTQETAVMETAFAFVQTASDETQTLTIPTPTLEILTATPGTPGAFEIIPPHPDQQVYTDPAGWYMIYFPKGWVSTSDKPNYFYGPEGSIETGYFPEMGYVSQDITVCVWLANVKLEPEKSDINWMPHGNIKCSVTTNNRFFSDTYYSVIENPQADPDHRFIYVIAKGSGWWGFSWAQEIKRNKFDPLAFPEKQADTIFWENLPPRPSNILLTEEALPTGTDPTQVMIPQDLRIEKTFSLDEAIPSKELSIADLGYEIKGSFQNGDLPRLYRDNRPLFDRVVRISKVYTFSTSSGQINAFTVNVAVPSPIVFDSFLIQNDMIYDWQYGSMDPEYPPILYNDELLWAKVNQDALIEVKKTTSEVVFSVATFFASKLYMDKFTSWDNHWILEAGDFIVQDGEVLNEKFDFEEVFEWGLVQGKSIYFFRKGPRIGLSYGDTLISLPYHDIARGMCCGFAANNPYMREEAISFFGKRNDNWYSVLIEFK